MISQLLLDNINGITAQHILIIEIIFTSLITLFTLNARFSFLPQDQGRAFAVNGQLSKGKIRGVGLIMVICFIISSLLFIKTDTEYIIYLLLIFLMMLSGYLDDASKIPWSDYKKGLIDGDYGFSTAVGLFNTIINVILLIAVNKIVEKINEGEGL